LTGPAGYLLPARPVELNDMSGPSRGDKFALPWVPFQQRKDDSLVGPDHATKDGAFSIIWNRLPHV